ASTAKAAADFALERGARSAVIVAGPQASDLEQAETLRQAAQDSGLRIVRTEALFPASTDYRDTVARLASASPDALLIAASLPTSAAFWREASGAARFGIVVGSMNTAPEDFLAVAGKDARSAYFPSPVPNLTASPALSDFATRYRARWNA